MMVIVHRRELVVQEGVENNVWCAQQRAQYLVGGNPTR